MRYFLDTEFNGFKGELLSIALVEDSPRLRSFYAVMTQRARIESWVQKNVIPILHSVPEQISVLQLDSPKHLPKHLETFFKGDHNPVIVTDWPDDIRYFCEAVITAPGEMCSIPRLKFEMHRVDAYPTRVADAIQHNAWWDAVALRQKIIELEGDV